MDLQNYTLLFEDQFDSLDLNDDSGNAGWKTTFHYGDRFLNNEQQIYVDSSYGGLGISPFETQDGVLTITAQEAPNNLSLPTKYNYQGSDVYTSGLLNSENKFSIQYGYFEISAKMPADTGAWSAFWLVQSNGKWPAEFDVVEVIGQNSQSQIATAHTIDGNGQYQADTGWIQNSFDSADGFHTYGLDWQADTITWYYDGVKVFETENTVTDQSMYMIVNLAMGGDWAGYPDDGTISQMEIDYIRVYQENASHVSAHVPSEWHDITVDDFSQLDIGAIKTTDFQYFYGYSNTLSTTKVAGQIDGEWPHELNGNDMDNYLVGSIGPYNKIDGRGGNDILSGGLGSDHFVVREGDGNDVILDFSNVDGNNDKVVLEGFHFKHFEDVIAFMQDTDEGALLRLDEDQALLFSDFYLANFTADQFIFVDSIDAPFEHVALKQTALQNDFLDLAHMTLSSYSNQDTNPKYVRFDTDESLYISGNSWKKLAFEYTITEDSVLTFDFRSTIEGEIHGIGLSKDNSHARHNLIEIYGTQDFAHQGPVYNASGDWQSFEIKLSDYFMVGRTTSYLTLINDDDAYAKADSTFANIRIFEQSETTPNVVYSPTPLSQSLSFTEHDFSRYTRQDAYMKTLSVEGDSTLHLTGNTWKAMDFDYEVTNDSYLRLDYFSAYQGEAQGLILLRDGLDPSRTDTYNLHNEREFIRLDGHQSYNGLDNLYDSEQDGWQTIQVKLSDYFMAGTQIDHLVFVVDDDRYGKGDSYFSNISVYESHDIYGSMTDDIIHNTSDVDDLYGLTGADRFMIDALNSGGMMDTIHDFNLDEGDSLDFSSLLHNQGQVDDAITDFINLTSNDGDTIVSIDLDGSGTQFDYQDVLVLENIHIDTTDLIDNNALLL